MNTNETIQTGGTKLANELKAGNRGTAAFVKLVADTHGIDVQAMQADILAVVNREFSKTLCSASEPALAAYASFRGAFTTKRFNRYVVDGAGGIVTVSFSDPEGTPKDSKARFVTCTYLSPTALEVQAKQAERDASKLQADVRKKEEQHKEEKDVTRAAMTAQQVLKRMLSLIPEISALSENDVFDYWQGEIDKANKLEQSKQDKQKQTGKDNKAARDKAASDKAARELAAKMRREIDAKTSDAEIVNRTGTNS